MARINGRDVGPTRWSALCFGIGLREDEPGRGIGFCDAAWVWEPVDFGEGYYPSKRCTERLAVLMVKAWNKQGEWSAWFLMCHPRLDQAREAMAHQVPWCVYRFFPIPENEIVKLEVL